MAVNLAYSLKCTSNLPIHLVTNNLSILQDQRDVDVFDSYIEADPSIFTSPRGLEYFRAKTCLYDLSPFIETIYLDVDMVALNNKTFDQLFETLKDVDLAIACRGSDDIGSLKPDISQWGNVPELVKTHGISSGKWCQLSSEFIYFKKCEKNREWFEAARNFFDNPKGDFLRFGGSMADELAFGMACLITGHYPHSDKFTPIYWPQAENPRPVKVLDPFVVENYYGYSMGHAYNHINQKGFYNNMMKFFFNKMGRTDSFFPAQNKKLFVPDREKI